MLKPGQRHKRAYKKFGVDEFGQKLFKLAKESQARVLDHFTEK
jgi:hypothetical protein